MMRLTFAAALLALASPALAQTAPAAAPAAKPVGRQLIEIYKIVPGQQEAFLRFVARLDAVNVAAGLPPRQLFVHQDGADWDFILIQPAATPPEKAAALEAASKAAGIPSGVDFFLEVRKMLASHSDTFASGPTTAADYLGGSARAK